MYGFSVITNDYGFLYEFAFRTGGYIRVVDISDELKLYDNFELCYPELRQMTEAKEALNDILLGEQAMLNTTLVLMTKKQLDLYIDLLDGRIEYLKTMNRNYYDPEYQEYIAMRKHAYSAKEFFRQDEKNIYTTNSIFPIDLRTACFDLPPVTGMV